MATATFTERILNTLEGNEPPPYQLDFAKATRILLRDGWHRIYRVTESDRAEFRKKLDGVKKKFYPYKDPTDEELLTKYPQFANYRGHPKLEPKPLALVMVNGERWLKWNESRDHESGALVMSEVLAPFAQVLAIDIERGIE
jgi:hypothetical protein